VFGKSWKHNVKNLRVRYSSIMCLSFFVHLLYLFPEKEYHQKMKNPSYRVIRKITSKAWYNEHRGSRIKRGRFL